MAIHALHVSQKYRVTPSTKAPFVALCEAAHQRGLDYPQKSGLAKQILKGQIPHPYSQRVKHVLFLEGQSKRSIQPVARK